MDGRDGRLRQQRHARRGAEERTHTGMKFSDTSFAGWRHQVRRSGALEDGRGRGGTGEGLDRRGAGDSGSVIKLMIAEYVASGKLSIPSTIMHN